MPRGGFALGAKSGWLVTERRDCGVCLRVFNIPVHGLCFDHCMFMMKSLMSDDCSDSNPTGSLDRRVVSVNGRPLSASYTKILVERPMNALEVDL